MSESFGDSIVNFKYELFDVNHEYTKEELIKNNNITSAIFLLDQKVDPLEFLNRLKAVALEFNKLTDTQKMILKHWIKNTVDETIAGNAVEILEENKEGVEKMVANNAFMIEEMKEKVKKETEKEVRKQEEELRKQELKKQEKQDKIDIAKNLMDILDDETIALKVGLSIEEVNSIRESIEPKNSNK